MSEQSDTPRTDATQHQWTRTLDLARTLERETVALRAEVERLRAGIDAVASLINESRGVYGLHQNGDPSPWDELREGGVFEEWLIAFDHALAATEAK